MTIALASFTDVVVWSVATGKVKARIKARFPVAALGFRADGALVVLEADVDSKLRVFRGAKQEAACDLAGWAFTLHVRGNAAAVGFTDGSIVTIRLR